MKWAFSKLYLVQRVALVVVLLRQAVGRVGADERAAGVCVTHRVNVGSWGSVRRSCNHTRQTEIIRNKLLLFGRSAVALFHSHVPDMAPKTSLCKLVSRKVLDLGGVIKALVRRGSSRPFWRDKNREKVNWKPHVYGVSLHKQQVFQNCPIQNIGAKYAHILLDFAKCTWN